MRIAVTGSAGFVGSALLPHLEKSGYETLALRRDGQPQSLEGVDAIVHLGGLAHRLGREAPTPEEFDRANHIATRDLAERASKAGVRRFVFISTINVVAANSGVLSPDLPIKPLSAYGVSKARAESALLEMPEIGPVVLRPPLVYGPHAKGNMGELAKLAAMRLPLPFASVRNRRTMVGLTNLVEAIQFAVEARDIDGRIFHVTDSRDISLAEIISTVRQGLGRPAGLFSFPTSLIEVALNAMGRKQMADQLFGDLIVDGSALNAAGWTARHDPKKDLLEMASGLKSDT